MADWKTCLRQAVSVLHLDSKLKGKADPPIVIRTANRPLSGTTAEESRSPRRGRPKDNPGKTILNVTPTRAKSKNPCALPLASLIRQAARVGKKSFFPLTKRPGVQSDRMPVPCGHPSPVAKSTGAFAAMPVFIEPNMANYMIYHDRAEGCLDQVWQSGGTRSALRASENRGRTQCTLGLDFGSAFTKACIQVRESALVVEWNQAVPDCVPSLLPSVFTELADGSCTLGVTGGRSVQRDLKTALLSSSGGDEESRVNATAFLALVTRFIRSWLFSQHADIVSGFNLEWSVNVGLPAAPWDDMGVRKLYKMIALAGWRLGAKPDPITISAAALVLAEVRSNARARLVEMEGGRVEAFPEFVAQISSYRKSPQRRLDLHLLIDVGAETVDVVTFHVWERGGTDRYSILEASVKRQGTHVLLGYRAEAGKLHQSRWDEAAARLSMPQFEAKFALSKGKLDPVQQHFVSKIDASVNKVLSKTKLRRYAHSPAWRDGVPFFLCGGGNNVDAYRDAITKVRGRYKLVEMKFPTPGGLVAGRLAREDFHRISVAHGLSYSPLNLGEVEGRSEVPDLPAPLASTMNYTSQYLEK